MPRDHEQCLRDLKIALFAIARDRGLAKAELQAQIVRNSLTRAIESYRDKIAAARWYHNFVEPWERENQRPAALLCYLLRLTSNKRSIGRRRGLKPLGSLQAAARDAASVQDVTQLTAVERSAFDILNGKRIRSKATQHPIERRAISLAAAVEAEWFPGSRPRGRPKGKWVRNSERGNDVTFDALRPPLTINEVVLETAPIIEKFAGCKIAAHGQTFDALYHTVCAYSQIIKRETPRNLQITRTAVYQALRRARRELRHREITDSSEETIPGK
jgi:hypothetical protein